MRLIFVIFILYNFVLVVSHNGGWSQWSSFGRCTSVCGKGYRLRTRSCSDPEPTNGGSFCPGPATEQIECFEKPCGDMIAVWTTWSGFSQCSRTCGQGTQTRTRQMNCTGIVSTSSVCLDKQIESKDCNSIPCDKIPLNGGWSSWKDMVKCSKSCGGGMRIRYRTCSNPIPANGGQFCVGASVETTTCNDQPCPAFYTDKLTSGFIKKKWSPTENTFPKWEPLQ